MRSALVRVVILWAALGLLLSTVQRTNESATPPTFATFLVELERGKLREVRMRTHDDTVRVKRIAGPSYTVGYAPAYGSELMERLDRADVRYDVEPRRGGALSGVLRLALPVALLAGFWLLVMRRSSAAGGRAGAFRRAPAREAAEDLPKTGFAQVAGADEAVEELREITQFLQQATRYKELGARIPSGVLLYGPPGTGKTLLARAVAGDAAVPFFSISGSEFVEMFVGVGASRVRDLFERAKKRSPAIVFVDEIDAIGRQRGAGIGGGPDEREQTLNQLLVEMDGFEATDHVIVIAATNRPDILDPALLRPGRFDRQIAVEAPDRRGRRAILDVHSRGKPLASEVNLDTVAGQTAGLTGADLANVVNEAALLAARSGRQRIAQPEMEEAILRVLAGPERRSRVLSQGERWVTAVHEMGHAIVRHCVEHADPVHKVSIVARGQQLGYTISLPSEDKLLTTEAELLDTMAVTLGGRAAEEIMLGEITTAASSDLEKVTANAKQMVMRLGMGQKLGARVFGRGDRNPLLGRGRSAGRDYSDRSARDIDREIESIVRGAHDRAKQILLERRVELCWMSEILLERETIVREEFEALLSGGRDAVGSGLRPYVATSCCARCLQAMGPA